MSRYRDVLRVRDFRLLVVSFIVDQIGSWSYSVVIAVYVFERTHSTFDIAVLTACRWIPGLLLSGYAGVIADRYERTRVMLVSALSSAVVMAGIAVAVGVDAPIWVLFVLVVCTAITGAPYRPAAGALTPEVVNESQLAAANAIYSTLESLTIVVGPAFGGLLLLAHTRVIGVIINTASFVAAAGIIVMLRVRSRGDAEPGGSMIRQWVDGLQALAGARVALTLVLFCGLDSGVYGASTVIYAPLSERLGTGVGGYSYLLAGAALGGVVAAALANRLSAASRLAPIIVTSITLQAAPFAVTVLTHSPEVAFLLQVVSGVGMIIVDVLAITALQRDLARGVLSRVLGVLDAVILAATAAASFGTAAVFAARPGPIADRDQHLLPSRRDPVPADSPAGRPGHRATGKGARPARRPAGRPGHLRRREPHRARRSRPSGRTARGAGQVDRHPRGRPGRRVVRPAGRFAHRPGEGRSPAGQAVAEGVRPRVRR